MRGNGSKDAGDMATSETGSARMETGSERKAAQRRRAAGFLEVIVEEDLAVAGNVNVVVAAEALSNIPPHSSAEEPGRVRTADGWRNAGLDACGDAATEAPHTALALCTHHPRRSSSTIVRHCDYCTHPPYTVSPHLMPPGPDSECPKQPQPPLPPNLPVPSLVRTAPVGPQAIPPSLLPSLQVHPHLTFPYPPLGYPPRYVPLRL